MATTYYSTNNNHYPPSSSSVRRALLLVSAALGVAALVLVVVASAGARPAQAQDTTGTAGTASGATIKVNTIEDESTDDGDCSLREAIEAVDTNAAVDKCKAGSATERDAIHFSLGKEATIVLGSQLPNIRDPSGLTINAQKAKITVSGNNKVRWGFVSSGAKLTLRNLTVADTYARAIYGGAISSSGDLTVINSTFSQNKADLSVESWGGAISTGYGTLTVINSTFANNSAYKGGAIYQGGGTLTATNSTFYQNTASFEGGAIYNHHGSVTLRNNILGESSGGNCRSLFTYINDGGYNIEDQNTCGLSADNNSQPSTDDPKLDPQGLQDNGGPTPTVALLQDSPAVDAIPKRTNGCDTEIKTDQRGVKRPQGKGNPKRCDIGAFEHRQSGKGA